MSMQGRVGKRVGKPPLLLVPREGDCTGRSQGHHRWRRGLASASHVLRDFKHECPARPSPDPSVPTAEGVRPVALPVPSSLIVFLFKFQSHDLTETPGIVKKGRKKWVRGPHRAAPQQKATTYLTPQSCHLLSSSRNYPSTCRPCRCGFSLPNPCSCLALLWHCRLCPAAVQAGPACTFCDTGHGSPVRHSGRKGHTVWLWSGLVWPWVGDELDTKATLPPCPHSCCTQSVGKVMRAYGGQGSLEPGPLGCGCPW